MHDYELGCWVAEQAKLSGVIINEYSAVSKLNISGSFHLSNVGISKNRNKTGRKQSAHVNDYDFVVNASGSYAEQLLIESEIKPKFKIDHIRGSHLVIDRQLSNGYLLEAPDEKRIFFVLPYNNQTLIGTTELRQSLYDPIQCSKQEEEYLINAYNYYFNNSINKKDIIDRFAGLRPLIKSTQNFSKASREYAIQNNNRLITVYGGKWTTARALAKHVCNKINS